MRKRPCPEGTRPWRGARTFVSAVLTLAGVGLAATVYVRAQAEKGIVGDRLNRVHQAANEQEIQQKADTETWSAAKILINLDARCPVISAVGFFGAFASSDPDPAKAAELQSRFAELQKTAQPMAAEFKKMAGANTFVGRKFPAVLVPRLNVMEAELYGQVLQLYGDQALAELKRYVAAQAEGVYVQD